MIDADLKELFTQLALAQAKTEAQLAASNAKAEERQALADERHSKFEAEMTRLNASIDKQMKSLDQQAKQLGGMANNQGDVAEEFFYNSLKKNPTLDPLKFDQIGKNHLLGNKKEQQEFDIVLINGNAIAIIEVKYKLHLSDLEQVQKQMKLYKKFMPVYKDYAMYGGVAGLAVPDDIIKEAQKQGLFVLQQVGNVLSQHTQNMRAH